MVLGSLGLEKGGISSLSWEVNFLGFFSVYLMFCVRVWMGI